VRATGRNASRSFPVHRSPESKDSGSFRRERDPLQSSSFTSRPSDLRAGADFPEVLATFDDILE